MCLSEHGSYPACHANNTIHNSPRIHRNLSRTDIDPIAIALLNHYPYPYPHTYLYPYAHTIGVLEYPRQS